MKQYIPYNKEEYLAVFKDFARIGAEADDNLASTSIENALSFVKGYTGLEVWDTSWTSEHQHQHNDTPPDGELCLALRYAILTIAAEMYDNRQMTQQYTGKNPTVMQILDMHSTNLLPSC